MTSFPHWLLVMKALQVGDGSCRRRQSRQQRPAQQFTRAHRAVKAARQAFDHGPWPRMTMAERAKFVTAIGEEMKKRLPLLIDVWTGAPGDRRKVDGASPLR